MSKNTDISFKQQIYQLDQPSFLPTHMPSLTTALASWSTWRGSIMMLTGQGITCEQQRYSLIAKKKKTRIKRGSHGSLETSNLISPGSMKLTKSIPLLFNRDEVREDFKVAVVVADVILNEVVGPGIRNPGKGIDIPSLGCSAVKDIEDLLASFRMNHAFPVVFYGTFLNIVKVIRSLP